MFTSIQPKHNDLVRSSVVRAGDDERLAGMILSVAIAETAANKAMVSSPRAYGNFFFTVFSCLILVILRYERWGRRLRAGTPQQGRRQPAKVCNRDSPLLLVQSLRPHAAVWNRMRRYAGGYSRASEII